MGLSASQARLLSITARLTQNETQSQLITNSKLRLADKSGEASKEYMDALNTTKFVYSNYDTAGNLKTQDMTFGAVTTFSDVKNQYGFVDTAGRLLVTFTDAGNYEKSANLSEFLSCYGIGDMDNPKREPALEDIYGEEHNDWYDEGAPHEWLDKVNGATKGPIGDMVTAGSSGVPSFDKNLIDDEAAYNKWKDSVIGAVDNVITQGAKKPDGIYNTWLDVIKDIPDFIEKPAEPGNPPVAPTPPNPDDFKVMEDFVQYVVNGQCYRLAESGYNCYMHVLSDLLGPGTHKTSSGQTFDVIASSSWDWNTCHVGISSGHEYGGQIDAVRDIIQKTPTQDDPNKTIYQKIVDFLWATHGDYDGSATGGNAKQENLDKFFEIIHTDLAAAKDTSAWDEAVKDYNKKYEEYLKQLEIYNQKMKEYQESLKERETEYINQLESWYERVQQAEKNYKDAIDNLPPAKVPNERDPKYQWYTNMWFRMGAVDENHKEPNKNHYKILDDYYISNSSWLKFALEHGIVSMEQVQYQEEGETIHEKMNQYAWVSIQYGNCADVHEETDEEAIAKAEAKYQQKTAEIQAKDKKYDTDLKKLDTAHSALQTEYDSIKSVIDKNVERSFKAFS